MNAKPKLKDTLDVFIDEIGAVKSELKKSQEMFSILEQRVHEIKNHRVIVDVSEIKKVKLDINDELKENTKELKLIFEQNYKSIQDIFFQKKNDRTSFFLFSFLFALILSISFYFNISQKLEIETNRDELKSLRSDLGTLNNYIDNTNQADEFHKWLENNVLIIK